MIVWQYPVIPAEAGIHKPSDERDIIQSCSDPSGEKGCRI